ncbi:hypothetical protein [Mycolicibacterium sp.]|nr:hypothetical protein [Mycolicibacterium sp.]MCB9410473.1 hypothetical protein [Mycolicibacterium sp.]
MRWRSPVLTAWQWQSAKNKLLNTIAALDPNSSGIRIGAQTSDPRTP